MFGESGTSQSGATYHYYKCSSAKKKTGCNRKPVKKKWIEDAVLDQVKIVLHDDVFIGDVIHKYLEYQQQENTVSPYLEKSLADTQRSIDNLIAAIEQGIITPSTKQRLETLEVSKRELEDKILIENMKRPLRTEDELWAWFRYMRNFDLTRLEERRQLIDVFVNTVFLYNDRFLLTLNFGYGSKTVLFTDIPCSDKVACGRPKVKGQPLRLLFCFFRTLEGQDLNRSGGEWDEGENATGRRFHPRSNENKKLKERAMPRRATTIFSEVDPDGCQSRDRPRGGEKAKSLSPFRGRPAT